MSGIARGTATSAEITGEDGSDLPFRLAPRDAVHVFQELAYDLPAVDQAQIRLLSDSLVRCRDVEDLLALVGKGLTQRATTAMRTVYVSAEHEYGVCARSDEEGTHDGLQDGSPTRGASTANLPPHYEAARLLLAWNGHALNIIAAAACRWMQQENTCSQSSPEDAFTKLFQRWECTGTRTYAAVERYLSELECYPGEAYVDTKSNQLLTLSSRDLAILKNLLVGSSGIGVNDPHMKLGDMGNQSVDTLKTPALISSDETRQRSPESDGSDDGLAEMEDYYKMLEAAHAAIDARPDLTDEELTAICKGQEDNIPHASSSLQESIPRHISAMACLVRLASFLEVMFRRNLHVDALASSLSCLIRYADPAELSFFWRELVIAHRVSVPLMISCLNRYAARFPQELQACLISHLPNPTEIQTGLVSVIINSIGIHLRSGGPTSAWSDRVVSNVQECVSYCPPVPLEFAPAFEHEFDMNSSSEGVAVDRSFSCDESKANMHTSVAGLKLLHLEIGGIGRRRRSLLASVASSSNTSTLDVITDTLTRAIRGAQENVEDGLESDPSEVYETSFYDGYYLTLLRAAFEAFGDRCAELVSETQDNGPMKHFAFGPNWNLARDVIFRRLVFLRGLMDDLRSLTVEVRNGSSPEASDRLLLARKTSKLLSAAMDDAIACVNALTHSLLSQAVHQDSHRCGDNFDEAFKILTFCLRSLVSMGLKELPCVVSPAAAGQSFSHSGATKDKASNGAPQVLFKAAGVLFESLLRAILLVFCRCVILVSHGSVTPHDESFLVGCVESVKQALSGVDVLLAELNDTLLTYPTNTATCGDDSAHTIQQKPRKKKDTHYAAYSSENENMQEVEQSSSTDFSLQRLSTHAMMLTWSLLRQVFSPLFEHSTLSVKASAGKQAQLMKSIEIVDQPATAEDDLLDALLAEDADGFAQSAEIKLGEINSLPSYADFTLQLHRLPPSELGSLGSILKHIITPLTSKITSHGPQARALYCPTRVQDLSECLRSMLERATPPVQPAAESFCNALIKMLQSWVASASPQAVGAQPTPRRNKDD